jgi:hypothetical protein
MNTTEIVNLLTGFEKRLGTIADQAQETREQAQHTLERINLLLQEIENVRRKVMATIETGEHKTIPKPN